MRKLKSIAIAALMLVAGTTVATAHEEKGPHGGQMVDASDGHHAELLVKEGKMTVYLLDSKGKAMSNKGITGSVILQFADKTSATVALVLSGDDGFSVANDKAGSFTSCIVTFKADGANITAKFKAAKSVAKTYTCPMHHEVTSDKPGKCPKCGMDLVEKKEEHHHNEGDHKH